MGEAKRRGSYAERVSARIEKVRIIKEQEAEEQRARDALKKEKESVPLNSKIVSEQGLRLKEVEKRRRNRSKVGVYLAMAMSVTDFMK